MFRVKLGGFSSIVIYGETCGVSRKKPSVNEELSPVLSWDSLSSRHHCPYSVCLGPRHSISINCIWVLNLWKIFGRKREGRETQLWGFYLRYYVIIFYLRLSITSAKTLKKTTKQNQVGSRTHWSPTPSAIGYWSGWVRKKLGCLA